jgi:hypothetical protein
MKDKDITEQPNSPIINNQNIPNADVASSRTNKGAFFNNALAIATYIQLCTYVNTYMYI